MDITNEFVVPLDPSETWKVLLDIKRIMPCVPGAELLDALDEQTYKGKVTVKLGPVALAFVGTAKFEELDEAAKRAKVSAKGSDAKGRGGANSVVQFRLEPVNDGTKVVVETNLNLSGSVAQYGRGTGVIQGVASQLTAQFAQNLKAMLAHQGDEDEPKPAEAALAPGAQGTGASQAGTDREPSAAAADVTASPVSDSASAAPAPAAAPGTTAALPVPELATVMAAMARTEAAAARAEAAAARVETAVGRVEAAVARAEAAATALKTAARSPAPQLPQAKPIAGFSLMLTVLWSMISGVFSSKKSG